jgi:hypothetical protein
MLEAGVDGVGVHLQADARRADPALIESDYLADVARAIFDRVGGAAPVQVVGGLSVAQAKRLARAGLRAFVISGNLPGFTAGCSGFSATSGWRGLQRRSRRQERLRPDEAFFGEFSSATVTLSGPFTRRRSVSDGEGTHRV